MVASGTEFSHAFAAAGSVLVSPDLAHEKDDAPTVAPALFLARTVTMPLTGKAPAETTDMVNCDTSIESALFSNVPSTSPVALHFLPVSHEPETFQVVTQAVSRSVETAIALEKSYYVSS